MRSEYLNHANQSPSFSSFLYNLYCKSLIQAQMISMPFGACQAYFQKLDPTSFCATPREIGTTCQGDSGSGIISDRGSNGRWEVGLSALLSGHPVI